MTQPARGNPRKQRERPMAQMSVWVSAEAKDAALLAADARGERLNAFVDRALRRQVEEDAKAAPPGS